MTFSEQMKEDYWLHIADTTKPLSRSACGGQRPCPFISCRYHLLPLCSFRDVAFKIAQYKMSDDDVIQYLQDMKETCALDVSDNGSNTLEHIGELAYVTRERVRQIESKGLGKIRKSKKKFSIIEMFGDMQVYSGVPCV